MRKLLFLLAGCLVGAILAIFALRQEFQPHQTSSTLPERPVCDSLPEQGPDSGVSLRTSRIANRPGTVCIRVYNGTPEFWSYESEALQIERCWFGLVCLSHLRLTDLLLVGRAVLKVDLESKLFPGYRDFYRSSPYELPSPGTYGLGLFGSLISD